MAATAAILVLLPGVAAAEVCDKGMLLADMFPTLDSWIESTPQKDQFRRLFTPASLVTAGILIWLIASNGTRATITAAIWFAALACFHAISYLQIDLSDPYYKAAVAEGCVENSPYRAVVNTAFCAAAVALTWQRIQRQKRGVPPSA